MCLPSGPKTQEIHFYPIPTEYESAQPKCRSILRPMNWNSLVPRLRDDVYGSMNGLVKAIASLLF